MKNFKFTLVSTIGERGTESKYKILVPTTYRLRTCTETFVNTSFAMYVIKLV